MDNYKPFLIAQIKEDQNRYLIENGNYSNRNCDTSDFNNLLYNNLDTIIPNTIRIFEINSKVYLTYYWLSDLREPRSNRSGIYLIAGIECEKSQFQKEPLKISKQLSHFINSLIKVTNLINMNKSDEVLKILWENDNNPKFKKIILKILEIYNVNNQSSSYNSLNKFVTDARKEVKLFKKLDFSKKLTISKN